MKRILLMVFVLTVLMSTLAAAEQSPVTFADLIVDFVEAYESPTANSLLKIDADVESLQDEIAASIAESWKTVYLDPDYQLLIYGKDDPARLQIPENGRDHAIVILGYELLNGEMTDELLLRQLNVAKKIRRTKGWIARKRKEAMPEHRRLTMTKQPALWTSRFWQYLVAGVIKGRCEAGAAVAKAYPASMLVCTCGATGENNPDQHTEAGLMKDYLVQTCGLDAGRILTDDCALTTVDNALNSFAIMQAKGIRTMTIVTSSYHQARGRRSTTRSARSKKKSILIRSGSSGTTALR